MDNLTETQALLVADCDAIKEMLLAKNRRYGNSAIEPKRMCSAAGPLAQIAVRIDDKLSRIVAMGGLEKVMTEASPDGEDVVADIIGYLHLARVAAQIAARRAPHKADCGCLDCLRIERSGGDVRDGGIDQGA